LVFPSNVGTGYQDSTSYNSGMFGAIFMTFLVILILVIIYQYIFNINVKTYIKGIFTPIKTIDIVIDKNTRNSNSSGSNSSGSNSSGSNSSGTNSSGTNSYDSNSSGSNSSESKSSGSNSSDSKSSGSDSKSSSEKQVFNIPGNYYTYDNAKELCSAYDAKLATYDQIEKAYNNGADWCNYGWSENQLALFPTQKKTYEELQKKPGHENDCGRQGVNGGYIANPNVKFGVNCFGYKPKKSNFDSELMNKLTPYPEKQEDIEFQQKVDKLKNKLNEIAISPFNNNNWDEE
jgi:hypothetical protein